MSNQIHACQAAACALWALCRHWHHPQVRVYFGLSWQPEHPMLSLPGKPVIVAVMSIDNETS